jgi:two-component system, LytTR family, sensor kinase
MKPTKNTISANSYYLFGFKKIETTNQLIKVIGVHAIAWAIFFTLPLFFFRIQFSSPNFIYRELINKLFLIIFFYFNYLFLIPRFFFKKRRIYFLLLFLSFLFLVVQHVIVEQIILRPFGQPADVTFVTRTDRPSGIFIRQEEVGGAVRVKDSLPFERHLLPTPGRKVRHFTFFAPEGILLFILPNVLSSAFLLVLLGGFINLSFMHLKSQNEKRSLENVNLKAELKLLKSQVNPHFLFNTLNGIYSQVYHKSDNAEISVLKLSEILRYVIYDSVTEMTFLEKDIHYLSNYIDLQRLRLSDKVTVDYSVEGEFKDLKIAPLLLIIFIENAFKHGISYTQPCIITIAIKVFDKTLEMVVSNPITKEAGFETSGIGLKNVKRRLELLYAGNYWLDIVQDKNFYVVNLRINLHYD